jgi:hypothetical protein
MEESTSEIGTNFVLRNLNTVVSPGTPKVSSKLAHSR